ncbi:hypothetical protein RvY_00146 [Ramazzottius varieornatus]|uniref:NR LBD domain-containing protein n=1 Tax=Ramazzottius varieornatus TaxID=947166 RepID=A0A1D1UC69_RAMVA|nr:hypothetical protein RvY_00146 [Ramazzottius varieornatus]
MYFLAVQNERQPRNSATIRYDMVEDRNLLDGTVAAAFYPVPPSSNISSSTSAFRSTGIANCCKSPGSSSLASSYSAGQHSSTSSPAESSTSHLPTPSLVPFFSVGMESVMYEAAARLLYQSVKWAKSLPYFVSLPFRDQITLLEESWSELFIMCAMQWSFPLGGYHLMGHSPDRGGATSGPTELRALTDAYNRFKGLTVDPNEFAYLKAIVLLKPAAKGLKEPQQVESLQDQAQVMLSQYEKLHHAAQPARFGKLLLLLHNLHEIPTERVESLFFARLIGNTPMEKILCDMYKS